MSAAPANTQALLYQNGFANFFATEALPGALPSHNSPQHCPYGLYAEQLSGTSFTTPRAFNRHTWLYRIRPAAVHPPFEPMAVGTFGAQAAGVSGPNQLRWHPAPLPEVPTDFLRGLVTYGLQGDPLQQAGCAIHLYAANQSMRSRAFYDADGELLLVPQHGRLLLITELGMVLVEPLEIAVIPRGVRFRVELPDGVARGYVCENFAAPLRLPELGPIGSNGLACERDFQSPVAWYEDRDEPCELVAKYAGQLWRTQMNHSPFDVVAWRGNDAPYKYDLRRFNTIGSVSFDHPDPSIFAVLQSIEERQGLSALDFVIFPPRWLVMEQTFRPPWFHRNVASEFMGLIQGTYDAKAEGFMPGGASLHNCMSAHGPDAVTVDQATRADTALPEHVQNTMAFMFETRCPIVVTSQALASPLLQPDYYRCWESLPKRFDPTRR